MHRETLAKLWPLSLVFLRGCGLPETLLEYLPYLLSQPIQFYSCFLSYSTRDQDFANRLYTDLQIRGVRCWFAPEPVWNASSEKSGVCCGPPIKPRLRHSGPTLRQGRSLPTYWPPYNTYQAFHASAALTTCGPLLRGAIHRHHKGSRHSCASATRGSRWRKLGGREINLSRLQIECKSVCAL
jgi:hypothetical protein